MCKCSCNLKRNVSRTLFTPGAVLKGHVPCGFVCFINDAVYYGVFLMQTAAQEGQDQARRAVNRTAVACSEARGTRMPKTIAVCVTSPVRVCLTTRYGCH